MCWCCAPSLPTRNRIGKLSSRLAALAGLTAKIDSDRGLILINGIPVWTRTPGGAVRGLQYVTTDGAVIRPDTIIVDDLETRETARSQAQTDKLKTWLAADALQTAGVGRITLPV